MFICQLCSAKLTSVALFFVLSVELTRQYQKPRRHPLACCHFADCMFICVCSHWHNVRHQLGTSKAHWGTVQCKGSGRDCEFENPIFVKFYLFFFFCNAVWAPSLPYPLLPCSLFVHPFPLSLPSHFSSLTQSGVTTTIITIALARSGIARLRTAT